MESKIKIFVFSFCILFMNSITANAQIAMAYAIDKNGSATKYTIDVSKETSGGCMNAARSTLEQEGYSKIRTFYGLNEHKQKSAIYVVIQSDWEDYQGNGITGYGFGVGNSCSEATNRAVDCLSSFFMWKSDYGYQQRECTRYTNYFTPDQNENDDKWNDNQQQDNNTNQNNNYINNSNNSNNSNSQSQYGENKGSNTQYSNQNTSNTTNQNPSNNYISQEEYNQNQKRLSDERYKAEKERIYEKGMAEIERTNVEYEQRQRLLEDGMTEFTAGIASGDRYERTGAVMTGAAKVFSSMGLDPEIAFGGALLVGALSALIKTEEEREAERLAAENERLFNEFQTIVKIADKKLLFAEQQDEYNYALYKESKDEYEKIVNNKFAGGYPSGMIYKIESLMETERIKDLMIDFSNEFNTEANNKYLLETNDKIYFYFATIQIDPKNRVSYLKTSNIFPVHYNNATLSWPFFPEIKNKIYSKQKTAIIKGYFKTKYDAEESKNNYIKLAKNNYYQVEDEYYSISFNQSDFKYNPYVKTDFWGNDKKSSSNKDNTDFWGNTSSKKTGNTTTERDSTSKAEFKTDFWGNPVSTKKDTSLKINNKPKEMKQSGELDFWGNPIKNEPKKKKHYE